MEDLSLATVIGYAFIGGLILNAMPCVFPMLGIKLMSVVKKANATKRSIRLSGLAYTAGVVLSFLAFAGVIALFKSAGKQVGWGFQLQSPIFIAGLTVLFVLMSLNFFGFFEMGLPGWLIPQGFNQRNGLAGEFSAGVMVAVVASPCTAPFMASALGYAISQPTHIMMLTFASLGFGLGAPFLLLTFVPSLADYLPRPGNWMIVLKQLLTFPLLLTVVWLVWVFAQQTDPSRTAMLLAALVGIVFLIWVYQTTAHRSAFLRLTLTALAGLPIGFALATALEKPDHVAPEVATKGEMIKKHGVTWHVFTPSIASELVQAGQTVFVDFTAAWCVTCQTNATTIFSSQKVLDHLEARRDVSLVLADWTNEDEAITQALEAFDRAGVPLYLVYKPGREVQVLPQILTPGIFLDAIAPASSH